MLLGQFGGLVSAAAAVVAADAVRCLRETASNCISFRKVVEEQVLLLRGFQAAGVLKKEGGRRANPATCSLPS